MSALTSKTVIITGASEGIGRALALALAPQKVRLLLAARNPARLQELADECKKLGSEAVHVAGDLSRKEDCKRAVDTAAQRFGGIDVLINNAGITMWANFEDTKDPELIDQVMGANYFSVAYCTHYALPHLIAAKGRIVGVSSMAGIIGVPGHAIYGASKHAIHGLLDSLRIELAPKGVSVTIVAPDFVVTEIHNRGLKADGTPMLKRLDPSKHMSAETCARLMLTAIERRQRLLMTSRRGNLAFAIRGLVPGLLDRLAAKGAKRVNLH